MTERLQIDITARDNTKGAFNSAQKSVQRLNQSGKRLNTTMGGLQSTLLKVGAALGGFAVVRSVVNTIRTFEDLKATLVTVEGSTEQAAKSFEMLRKFTAKTTFQLDEVSTAFITLRNAGLQPTEKMMEQIGNIAAGMGKRLDDVARAVFNATTGEFEMLKQLGIKVRTEGDKLRVSFRGITQQIDNDSQSIVGFLTQVGEVDFAGAIAARSATLTGAISNMRDALAEVAVAIGEGGFAGALTDVAKRIKDFAMNSRDTARAIGDALGAAIRGTANAIAFLVTNIDIVTGAFATLLSYKIATAFISMTTALAGLNAGMVIFNNTTKRNIIFGSIAAFGGALAYLIRKFREFKGDLTGVSLEGDLPQDLATIRGELDELNELEAEYRDRIAKRSGQSKKANKQDLEMINKIIERRKELLQQELALEIQAELDANKAKIDQDEKEKQLENEKLLRKADNNKKAFESLQESLLSETEAIDHEKNKQLKILEDFKSSQEAVINASDKSEAGKLIDRRELYKAIEKQKTRILFEAINKRMAIIEKAVQDDMAKQMEAATLFAEILGDSTRKLELEYANRQRIIEKSYQDGYLTAVQYARLTEALERKKLKAIAEAEKQYRVGTIQEELEAAGVKSETARKEAEDRELYERDKTEFAKKKGLEALENMAKINKKAFEAYKAYQIAQATMETFGGVARALRDYPFPISLLVGGAVLASGLAQVSAIRSQQFTPRRFGGPVREGESYIVGEQGPELFSPSQNGSIIPNDRLQGKSVVVNFRVDAIDAQSFTGALAEQRDTIVSIVNEAVNDGGRRSLTA